MFQVITFAHVLQYLQQFITAHKSLQTTKSTLLGPQAMYFPPRPVDICQTLYTDSAISCHWLLVLPATLCTTDTTLYYLSYRMLCWSNIVLCFSSFQNTTVQRSVHFLPPICPTWIQDQQLSSYCSVHG